MKRLFVLVIIIMLMVCGCNSNDNTYVDNGEETNNPLRSTVLYFETNDGYIIPVAKKIPWEEGIAKAALSYLIATDDNINECSLNGLNLVIPEGTSFEIKIDDNKNAEVNVVNLPNFDDALKENVFLQTVVNTLTEFESIETVTLKFDGKKTSKMPNGTRVQEKMKRFNLNPVDEALETMTTDENYFVTAYIPDKTCCYNVPVTGICSGTRNFEAAMKMFCSTANCLPYGTDIISAAITDGIAVVNFSKEFGELSANTDGALQSLYKAIYLTATEYAEIRELKLFVDSTPLEYNYDECISYPLYINEWQS